MVLPDKILYKCDASQTVGAKSNTAIQGTPIQEVSLEYIFVLWCILHFQEACQSKISVLRFPCFSGCCITDTLKVWYNKT